MLGNGINIGIGVLFALWCARRQQLLSQRWREFAETPRWHEQGGWLVAFGWLTLSLILGTLVISSVYTVVGQTAFEVMFPQQRYSARRVSVTLPAGWNPLSPEQFTIECATSEFTCLVDAEDRWDGFSATLFLVTDPEGTAASVATEMANQVHTQYPWLPKLTPRPFSLQFVRDREALTFSGNVNSVTFIATTIADGSSVISFILNCPDVVAVQCQSPRDQIVATLEFASPV